MASREHRVTRAFAQLADTLVADYDVADLLHTLTEHCVRLLDAAEAGLMLADHRGQLQVLASSTERTRLLELLQLETDEGPCVECYRSRAPVLVPDLAAAQPRWPVFAPEALREGFAAVHALPMRVRDQTIGALNLFGRDASPMSEEDLALGQALADTATVGIVQERAIRSTEVLVEQLQSAFSTRAVIEQAKGVLVAYADLDMDGAFQALRAYARHTDTRLSLLARAVAEQRADIPSILAVDDRRG